MINSIINWTYPAVQYLVNHASGVNESFPSPDCAVSESARNQPTEADGQIRLIVCVTNQIYENDLNVMLPPLCVVKL